MKVLLLEHEGRSFYNDYTYRMEHWPEVDFSKWKIEIEPHAGKVLYFMHATCDKWTKWPLKVEGEQNFFNQLKKALDNATDDILLGG